MNLTSDLIVQLNVEPSVDAILNAKSRKFDGRFTELFVLANIVIKNLDCHIFSNIFDVDLKSFVEDRGHAVALFNGSLEYLSTSWDLNIRIHLSKDIRVTLETGFDYCEG